MLTDTLARQENEEGARGRTGRRGGGAKTASRPVAASLTSVTLSHPRTFPSKNTINLSYVSLLSILSQSSP